MKRKAIKNRRLDRKIFQQNAKRTNVRNITGMYQSRGGVRL